MFLSQDTVALELVRDYSICGDTFPWYLYAEIDSRDFAIDPTESFVSVNRWRTGRREERKDMAFGVLLAV
jgi:hypothetical protein